MPDGDPEGLRILSQKNWTGVGLVFPRTNWPAIKKRPEFERTGVYILYGYGDDPDIPLVYIGQTDELWKRIDQHEKNKEFWDQCVVFVSTDNFLNRAHVEWLEAALFNRAKDIGRCVVNNSQSPRHSSMSESDVANMETFLSQMMQVYPLTGIQIFEKQHAIAINPSEHRDETIPTDSKDTIIVPANQEGFEEVFIGENCWYAIRIGGGMLNKIKHIAAYQTKPISSVTHLAEVDHIEPYGDNGKYKVVFNGPAKKITPIPFGAATGGAMQGPRYTNFDLLQNAKTLADLL